MVTDINGDDASSTLSDEDNNCNRDNSNDACALMAMTPVHW